jgi:hypothetical protein
MNKINEICLKIWLWSKAVNWFRVVFVVVTAYFAIAGYVDGWFNSVLIAGVFGALYQLGYYSALTDQVNGNIE